METNGYKKTEELLFRRKTEDLDLVFEHLLRDSLDGDYYNCPANLFRSYVTKNKQAKDYEAMGQVRGLLYASLKALQNKVPEKADVISNLYDRLATCDINEEEETINDILCELKENGLT